ncbi:MAG: 50S ribosomal protein L11 methyltransferase [Synechococcaceae bacterium WBB_3_034]|nr:50S ribosomal protein L11 methyltransferase [Synechococcaceae bacterium WBB_3_034]
MALSWWRLELPCPPELEDSLTWKLNALGIHRVALQHRPEAPEQRQLVAWLPAADWPAAERQQLPGALAPLAATFGLELAPLAWREQADEDWSLSWKQHWQPDPVGQRLLILPAWLELPPEHADRLVIRMDPGSAFGTGSHPTTRLCLEAIEQLQTLPGARVADLGCGSGILGIAALLQGARSVAAADTDSLAVRATADNAAVSGFSDRLQVALGSVERLAELLEGRPADLLLCNILAPVIEALSPAFSSVLAPDGLGLLSGLLVDQAPRLQAVLAEQGWRAELTAQQSQWGLMTLRRAEGS